jgi:NADPH:quinone reductase-like Zn-dependent oxidoreductase
MRLTSVASFHEATFINKQAPSVNELAGFQEYTRVPAEIAAKVVLWWLIIPSLPSYCALQIPDNVSFDQAASIPLGICTAAMGFYSPVDSSGAGLTPPWEPTGEGKYKGQGILIFGGSSSVGQYGK